MANIIQQLEDLKEWAQNPERYARRLKFRSTIPSMEVLPEEFDEFTPREEEYYKQEPFSTREDFLGAKGGVAGLVQPGQPGVRQGYRGEAEITKRAKEYQKITGSETTLNNIKSRVRRNIITEDLIDKYKRRGPYGSGFRGKEIEAVTNPKVYKTVLSELNKVKKQRNKNVFFNDDDVIKTGKCIKIFEQK